MWSRLSKQGNACVSVRECVQTIRLPESELQLDFSIVGTCSCLSSCLCCCLCASWSEQTDAAQELTNDRLGSEADLTRLLGTLRYLQGLKAARQQVEEAAASPEAAYEPQALASTTDDALLSSHKPGKSCT